MLSRKLLPKLDKAGIHVLNYSRLSKSQKEKADAYFKEVVYPVLTPLALDPGHPFPHISNLSVNLAIVIRDPKAMRNLRVSKCQVHCRVLCLSSIHPEARAKMARYRIIIILSGWNKSLPRKLACFSPGMEVSKRILSASSATLILKSRRSKRMIA